MRLLSYLALTGVLAITAVLPVRSAESTISKPLTLDSAVRIALENHNQIGIAESRREAAEARLTQSRSAWFPRVTPSYQHTSQKLSSGLSTSRNTTAISLQQTIFDSGIRETNIAQSRDALRSSEYSLEDTRQGVILNATTAWYELRRSKELVKVADSGVERARTTLEATKAFVEAGSSPKKDVLQAQADYQNALVSQLRARNDVRLAQTNLKIAIGVMSVEPVDVVETEVAVPSAEPDNRPLADIIAQAYANRPDLKSAETNVKSSERSVRIARIEAGPMLESSFSAGHLFDPDRYDTHSLMATVTYPLFDAGASKASVKAAKASLKQAEESIELSRRAIAQEVESAWLTREEARQRITAAQAALAASRENYAAASESRKEGAGTILDVITAQNQLVTAETNAVQAVYDYHTASARLERALGSNDPSNTGVKP
jgi:outer membrane protein